MFSWLKRVLGLGDRQERHEIIIPVIIQRIADGAQERRRSNNLPEIAQELREVIRDYDEWERQQKLEKRRREFREWSENAKHVDRMYREAQERKQLKRKTLRVVA